MVAPFEHNRDFRIIKSKYSSNARANNGNGLRMDTLHHIDITKTLQKRFSQTYVNKRKTVYISIAASILIISIYRVVSYDSWMTARTESRGHITSNQLLESQLTIEEKLQHIEQPPPAGDAEWTGPVSREQQHRDQPPPETWTTQPTDDLIGVLAHPSDGGLALSAVQKAACQLYGEHVQVHSVSLPPMIRPNWQVPQRKRYAGSNNKRRNFRKNEFKFSKRYVFKDCEIRNDTGKNCVKKGLQVIQVPNDGSSESVMDAFAFLYSKGVRTFFVSQNEQVILDLSKLVDHQHLDKVSLVSPVTGVQEEWTSTSSLLQSQALLIESLISGFHYDSVLPVVTEERLWVLPILKQVLERSGRRTLAPIYFPNNASLSRVEQSIRRRLSGSPVDFSVFLSIGDRLKGFMLHSNITKSLNGAMVLVHSHPYDLAAMVADHRAKLAASKLNVITSVFTSTGNHNESNPILKNENMDILHPPELMINAASELLKVVKERDLQSHAGELVFARPSVNHNNGSQFKVAHGVKKVFRLIFLPEMTSDIHYSTNQSWFIDSEFIGTFRNDQWNISKKFISHHIISMKEILELLNPKARSCEDISLTFESKNCITGAVSLIRNLTSKSKVLVPRLRDDSVWISLTCHITAGESIHVVECSYGDSLHVLTCTHLGDTGHHQDGRGKRSVNLKPIHQQILTTAEYKSFQRHYYGQADRRPTGRSLRRTYSSVEYTPESRWENFKALVPQVIGCFGSTFGCTFCFIFLFYITVQISTGVCMGACGVAVGGSCGTVFALGFQRMLHQTVICSELYRQGLMPLDSYIADGRYGNRLSESHPEAMAMYRALAGPVVQLMQGSRYVTELINDLSLPLREHMDYAEGLRSSDNATGREVISVALYVLAILAHLWTFKMYYLNSLVLLTAIIYTLSKNSFKHSRKR